MTPMQQYQFEQISTDMIEYILKKVGKVSDKHGFDLGFPILANVGQLACGVALSMFLRGEDEEKSKEAYDQMCQAIWNSAQRYKSIDYKPFK